MHDMRGVGVLWEWTCQSVGSKALATMRLHTDQSEWECILIGSKAMGPWTKRRGREGEGSETGQAQKQAEILWKINGNERVQKRTGLEMQGENVCFSAVDQTQ